MTGNTLATIVVPGDRIRISVALIEQIAAEPEQTSIAATIVRIAVADDGTKILYLSREGLHGTT